MTISTYAELQTAINSWLARTDLATNVPDFIANFEAVANRRLRVRQQETSATLTPVSGSATLPADYLSFRRVTWAGSPLIQLEYVTPEYMNWRFTVSDSSLPTVFTIEGSTLTVRPTNDSNLTLEYFQKIPSLASSSTNWLLTAYPDLYLYGSLYQAYEFIRDYESSAFRKAQRDEIFDEILILSNKTRGVGGMRVLGPTP
jgi:hypothetical protein